jgi:hypothetical protein
MARERIGRRVTIPCTQSGEDAAVVGIAFSHASRLDVHGMRDVQRGGVLHALDEGRQTRGVGGTFEQGVELRVGAHPRRGVCFLLHAGVQGGRLLELRFCDVRGCKPHRQRLEGHADLVDLAQLVHVEFVNHGAAVGVESNQLVRRQVAQSLANRGRAHLELDGELGLDEACAAGQLAAEDGVPQCLPHDFMRRETFSSRPKAEDMQATKSTHPLSMRRRAAAIGEGIVSDHGASFGVSYGSPDSPRGHPGDALTFADCMM